MDSTSMTTVPTDRVASRRNLLAAGSGLAATAVLAACSNHGPKAGLSGAVVAERPVATVPDKPPTAAQKQADLDFFATANSLELLAADVYKRFGSQLQTPELVEAAQRFVDDHTAAAEVFEAEVAGHEGVGEPNAYMLTNLIEPITSLLTNETAVADLASGVESAIAATYIAAVGTLVESEWRQTTMEHGAAAARRAAVFGNGGKGLDPASALYPATDLIPADAYLITVSEEEAAAEAEAAATEEAAG